MKQPEATTEENNQACHHSCNACHHQAGLAKVDEAGQVSVGGVGEELRLLGTYKLQYVGTV